MHSTKQELLSALNKVNGLRILVVGDVILDRYIWGAVDRISPEAPVPVVEVKRVEDRLGGAGNVCRNLRRLGVQASLCAVVGDDLEGQTVLNLLGQDQIEKDGVMIDRGRPTSLKTRVIAHKQQIVRIDRESRSPQSPALREGFAAVVEAHIDANQGVILSDYGKGCISDPLLRRLEEARNAKRLGLKVRPLVLDPNPGNYGIYRSISIAKPNRKEAEAASGMQISDRATAIQAARVLLQKWNAEMMLVTLGEDGLVIVSSQEKEPLVLDTLAIDVFDVSGAGDTVTAIFTAAVAAGCDARVAGDLANLGAGIVVSEIGTVAVDHKRLQEQIEASQADK